MREREQKTHATEIFLVPSLRVTCKQQEEAYTFFWRKIKHQVSHLNFTQHELCKQQVANQFVWGRHSSGTTLGENDMCQSVVIVSWRWCVSEVSLLPWSRFLSFQQ